MPRLVRHARAGLGSLVLAVAIAGCAGSPKPARPAVRTCADAAASAEQIILRGATEGPRTPEDGAILREVIAARCPADGWSQASIDCMAAATTGDEATACANQLTQAQVEAIGDELARRAPGMGPGADEPPAAGSPAPPPPPSKAASPRQTDPCGGDE